MGVPHRRHLSPFTDKQACGSPSPLPPVGSASCFRAPGPTESSGPSFHLVSFHPKLSAAAHRVSHTFRAQGQLLGRGQRRRKCGKPSTMEHGITSPSGSPTAGSLLLAPGVLHGLHPAPGTSAVGSHASLVPSLDSASPQSEVNRRLWVAPPAHTWNSPAAHGSERGPGRPGPFQLTFCLPLLTQSRPAQVNLKAPSAHWSGRPHSGGSPVIPDARHTRPTHSGRKEGALRRLTCWGIASQTGRTQGEAGGAQGRGQGQGKGPTKPQQQKVPGVQGPGGWGGTEALPRGTGSRNPGPQGVACSTSTRSGLSNRG